MNQVRRSVLLSVTDKYLTQIILLITTSAMARLLTPAETGLFLVANTVILLADNLRTFGVGVYIVQERELRREAIRTAFTLTMLLSLLMMLAIYFGANEIARFYGEPSLGDLLRTASLGFIIIPFASPILALLQREFAFKTLAIINVCAALINSAVSIALGAAGAGPESYVWGFVASAAALVVFAFLARPEGWISPVAGRRSVPLVLRCCLLIRHRHQHGVRVAAEARLWQTPLLRRSRPVRPRCDDLPVARPGDRIGAPPGRPASNGGTLPRRWRPEARLSEGARAALGHSVAGVDYGRLARGPHRQDPPRGAVGRPPPSSG